MIQTLEYITTGTSFIQLPSLEYKQLMRVTIDGLLMAIRNPSSSTQTDDVKITRYKSLKQKSTPPVVLTGQYVIKSSQVARGNDTITKLEVGPVVVEGTLYIVAVLGNSRTVTHKATAVDTPVSVAIALRILIGAALTGITAYSITSSGRVITIETYFPNGTLIFVKGWFICSTNPAASPGETQSIWQEGFYTSLTVMGENKTYLIEAAQSGDGAIDLPAPDASYDFNSLTEISNLQNYLAIAGYTQTSFEANQQYDRQLTNVPIPAAGMLPTEIVYDEAKGLLNFSENLAPGLRVKIIFKEKE